MASKNDITGDWIKSKPNNDMFEKNFDLIFRKKKEVQKSFDFEEHRITIEHPTKVDKE